MHSGSSDWAMRRKGANAISGLCRLLAALEAEAWDSNTSPGFPDLPFTLTPTILKGGTFESIVPESASALLDLRLPPHVDAEEILSRISTIVQRTMEQGGDGCEASVDVRVRLPAYQIPTDHPLATTCADVVQEVTGQWRKWPSISCPGVWAYPLTPRQDMCVSILFCVCAGRYASADPWMWASE